MPKKTKVSEKIPALLPEPSVWQAALLRLTAFPVLDPQMKSEGWWEHVVGAAPELRSSQPRQGVQQESGPYLNGTLTLDVNPLRIDWLLGPNLEQTIPPDSLPTVGAFLKLVDAYSSSLSKWLASAPQLKRLAFGTILLQDVASHHDGYILVDKYLPAVTLNPSTSDFLYSINRPRSSTVLEGLKINRLSKWAVAKVQGVHLQVQGTADDKGNVISGVATREVYACRLELDINTDGARTEPLATNVTSALFGELIGLSIEIATNGDHP